jgi:hypothetical protein
MSTAVIIALLRYTLDARRFWKTSGTGSVVAFGSLAQHKKYEEIERAKLIKGR